MALAWSPSEPEPTITRIPLTFQFFPCLLSFFTYTPLKYRSAMEQLGLLHQQLVRLYVQPFKRIDSDQIFHTVGRTKRNWKMTPWLMVDCEDRWIILILIANYYRSRLAPITRRSRSQNAKLGSNWFVQRHWKLLFATCRLQYIDSILSFASS